MSDKYDKLTLTKKLSIFCYFCMYRFNNAAENVELIAFEKSIFWFDKSDKHYIKKNYFENQWQRNENLVCYRLSE